jgi:apolipoprotein D and lipocalin family protein
MYSGLPTILELDGLQTAKLDQKEYLGRWYERIRLPLIYEKGLSHVDADYRLSPNGDIRVINSGWKDKDGTWNISIGAARKTDNPAVLLVTFDSLKYSPYVVLYYDANISIVGSPSRSFLWLLTRNTDTEFSLQTFLNVSIQNGYSQDTLNTLEYVSQI